MRNLVCLLLCSSSVALAGHGDGIAPTRVAVGPPRGGAIDRVAITARSHLGHLHVTLAMDLSTRAKDMTEVALPLQLSNGASVIGLVLGDDKGETYDAPLARDRYTRTVNAIRDPALLERKGPDRYALSVFPVARGAGVRVTVELALPDGAPLLLTGVGRATIDLDGTPRRLAMARPVSLADALEEETVDPPTPVSVDAEVSLLALPAQYDPAVPLPVPNLSGFHAHIPLMPTVTISERTRVKPFPEDKDAQPLKRVIVMYSHDE